MDAVMAIIKAAAQLYIIQAVAGFVAGFIIPWLQFYHVTL
jgi:hypothetical protein